MSEDTEGQIPEKATDEVTTVALAVRGGLSRWENEGGAVVYIPLASIDRRDGTTDGSR